MFPTIKCNQKYLAYDIITKTKNYILGKDLGYNSRMDSTGTATHINSYCAIIHAIGELIEKNALLRIWYKQDVKNISDIGWNPSMNNSEKTYFLLNDFFFPYYVVFAATKDNTNFWHCGLGFSLGNLDKAKKAAYEEMKLIWFQNDIDKLNPDSPVKLNSDILVYWRWTESQKIHIDNLIKNAQVKSFFELNNFDIENIEDIGNLFTHSLKNLYIVFIPDPMFSGSFSTIRCFSRDLISCVPNKNLLTKLLTSSSIRFISKKDVKNNIDCPIV